MQRREFLRAAGAGAGAIATGTTSAAAQENGTEGGGGGGSRTVVVGPDGDLVFQPADISIQPGTTVIWEWDSDFHNVAPTSIPEGATWEGHPEIANAGTTYRHTFETEGTFEYVCDPHSGQGMEGVVEVSTNAGQEGGGSRTIPATAMNLAIGVVAALVSALTLVLLSLKYGWQSEE